MSSRQTQNGFFMGLFTINTTDLLPHPAGSYSRTHNIATKTPITAPVLKISMELSFYFSGSTGYVFPLLVTCEFRGSGKIILVETREVEKNFMEIFRTITSAGLAAIFMSPTVELTNSSIV